PVPIDDEGKTIVTKLEPVVITGHEGAAVQLAPCCHPIPGDRMVGNLKRDQGLVVHTVECEQGKRMNRKEPGRWTDVTWGKDLNRRFDCCIKVLAHNEKGMLARIAVE